MDSLKEKVRRAKTLRFEYAREYDTGDFNKGKSLELEYLSIRKEILSAVDESISRQRSIPIREIEKKVAAKPKVNRIETGIKSLDMELVSDEMRVRGDRGGMALGNFVQIAGAKGTGKSTFMMKILTGFSKYEKVCWFDFEMGEDRVIYKLKSFDYNSDNLLYYSASRDLEEITSEIKYLQADGVSHFVIDSAMKINVKGADRYDKFSNISGRMSELTSSLGINIYMINQVSQSVDSEGKFYIKHGNDAEYDADFIFFITKMAKRDDSGKKVLDSDGNLVVDNSKRKLFCEKNRQDERLFNVVLPIEEITGKQNYDVEVSVYSE